MRPYFAPATSNELHTAPRVSPVTRITVSSSYYLPFQVTQVLTLSLTL